MEPTPAKKRQRQEELRAMLIAVMEKIQTPEPVTPQDKADCAATLRVLSRLLRSIETSLAE